MQVIANPTIACGNINTVKLNSGETFFFFISILVKHKSVTIVHVTLYLQKHPKAIRVAHNHKALK
jgi:hypothetical protein